MRDVFFDIFYFLKFLFSIGIFSVFMYLNYLRHHIYTGDKSNDLKRYKRKHYHIPKINLWKDTNQIETYYYKSDQVATTYPTIYYSFERLRLSI